MISAILNSRLATSAQRRQVAGWDLPVTTEQDVSFALKARKAQKVPPLPQVLDALARIGSKGSWLREEHYAPIIAQTGTTRKFLGESIARVNKWLAEIHEFVALQGTVSGDGELTRGVWHYARGIPTALILAGDASSLAPLALSHAMIAGARCVVKASSVEPLSPFLFCQALMEEGLPSPNLMFFDSSVEAERTMIRRLIETSSQSVVYGEDKTVATIYGPLPFNAAHKPIAYWSGRSAVIAYPDADLEALARATVWSVAEDRGNRCICTKKLIAPRALQGKLEPLLVAAADAIVRGDPNDPKTEMGALDPGSRRAAEAAAADSEVFYDRELLMARSPDTSTLMREELPFPVLGIRYYDDGEDPVAIANKLVEGTATNRALVTSVFTRSPEQYERAAAALSAYKTMHNAPTVDMDHHTPHQGMYLYLELMRPRAVIRARAGR